MFQWTLISKLKNSLQSVRDVQLEHKRLYARMIEGLDDDYCPTNYLDKKIALDDLHVLETESKEDAMTVVGRNGNFTLIYTERGVPYTLTKGNMDEVLFAALRSAAFSLACNWELKNRIENQDFRRQAFPKCLELLGKISTNWAERELRHQNAVLRDHPFGNGYQ